MLISRCEAFSPLIIFQLSGWALMAPSCFALQVPDVKGLHDPGCHVLPFLARISLTQCNTYVHVNILDPGLAVRFQPGVAM